MKFEDYCLPFEGDLPSQMRECLGNQSEEYSRLQEAIDRYCAEFDRASHLKNIIDFYRIAITTGARDLLERTDAHRIWVPEHISSELEGKRIADIGCSNGLLTVFCALNHPTVEFVGVDISPESLASAKQRAEKHGAKNVRWVLGDFFDHHTRGEFQDADSIILKDSLRQFFGRRNSRWKSQLAALLSQKEGQRVILAESSPVAFDQDYGLDSYRQETLIDRPLGCWTSYVVSVSRRMNHLSQITACRTDPISC